MEQVSIVLGVIGSDCHAVGNKILEKVFSDAGFKVVNLGVMVSQDEFIHAAIETGAKALVVSSLYGQAELDCPGLRQRCQERGLPDIILYIGGRLVIGKHHFKEIEDKFLKMGFDRVFSPDCNLDEAIGLLKQDITQRWGSAAG
ncbi:MAG: methylaspartate mutase subunit S [Planctomycetales bacterium]|nr:methylaspartate mutase subunit S [Planctomycetales bacterium]